MDIVHLVLGKANPDRMNGVNKVVYQLATQQHLAGKRVELWGITPNTDHDYGDRVFSTSLFPAMRNPFSLHESLRESLLERDKNTIFHLHGGWIPTFHSIGKLLAKHKIPFVLTPHGAYNTVAMQKSKWKKFFYFYMFENSLIKRAKYIHCLGKSEVLNLQKIYPNNKTILLPYGYDIGEQASQPTKSKSFVIGFMGRLDVYTKGLDILLDAFEKFLQKNPNTELWIVGDGEQKYALYESIQEKNIRNHITFFGAKFGKQKSEILQKMDVFVHPSRNEGLPSSILEACAVGLPCIVSSETNMGEYIADYNSGLVLPKNTPEHLENAFCKMLEMHQMPAFQTLRENAIRMVKEAFSWQKLVQEFDVLYS